MDKPEECSRCGYDTEELEFVKTDPLSRPDEWLCPYCMVCYEPGSGMVIVSVASMFNEFEKRIRAQSTGQEVNNG